MHRCMTQGCSESGATWCGGTLLCFEHAAIVELSCEESLGLGLAFSDVKGHRFLPGSGRGSCLVAVTRVARWWPWDLPKGAGVATTGAGG